MGSGGRFLLNVPFGLLRFIRRLLADARARPACRRLRGVAAWMALVSGLTGSLRSDPCPVPGREAAHATLAADPVGGGGRQRRPARMGVAESAHVRLPACRRAVSDLWLVVQHRRSHQWGAVAAVPLRSAGG